MRVVATPSSRMMDSRAPILASRFEPITVAEWLESPEVPEYSELHQGMIVLRPMPDTHHQLVLTPIAGALLLAGRAVNGVAVAAPTAVRFGPYDAYEPDILYLSPERTHLMRRRMVDGPPDIVVEVSSPSTRMYDLRTKLPAYLAGGVREVWIADPVAKTVSVYEPGLDEPRVAAFGERIPSNIVEVGTAGLERLPPSAPD